MLGPECYASEKDRLAALLQECERESEVERNTLLILEWIAERLPVEGDPEELAVALTDGLYGGGYVAELLDRFSPRRSDSNIDTPTRPGRPPAIEPHVIPPPIPDTSTLGAYLTLVEVAALERKTPHAIRCIVTRARRHGQNPRGFPVPLGNSMSWKKETYLRWKEGG